MSNYAINLPNHYSISFNLLKKSTTNSTGTINVWDTNNHCIGCGVFGASSYAYELGYYNGSSWNRQSVGTASQNVEKPLVFEYDNGTVTLTDGTTTKTLSQSITPVKIDIGNSSQTNIEFRDVIIKPL